MKIWVTKYALTQGIFDAEAEMCSSPGMVEIKPDPKASCRMSEFLHGEGKDWHRTEGGAVDRALEMAARKKKAMQNGLKALDATTTQLWKRREELMRLSGKAGQLP